MTQRILLISLPFTINWRHYLLIYHAGILVIGWLNLSQYLEWISGFQGSLVITEYIYEKRLKQTLSCHGKQMCFTVSM